ncbi:hypothetical protein ATANTOWER_015005 [Ataeniobius toweri]|uniref:Uncharacterized protein n=1 Tax=Ataeniobius toweri TaxID=208326 RepID=A0ABU7BBR8_9TELE|nr:hypothetical protein [Ataeniobius toweri]
MQSQEPLCGFFFTVPPAISMHHQGRGQLTAPSSCESSAESFGVSYEHGGGNVSSSKENVVTLKRKTRNVSPPPSAPPPPLQSWVLHWVIAYQKHKNFCLSRLGLPPSLSVCMLLSQFKLNRGQPETEYLS